MDYWGASATVIAAIIAALLAAFLVDRRWLKERRLAAYAEVLATVADATSHHLRQTMTDDHILAFTRAINAARLLATDATNEKLEVVWGSLEALRFKQIPVSQYKAIEDSMGDFSGSAREDVTHFSNLRSPIVKQPDEPV